jgi:hypothetical protein
VNNNEIAVFEGNIHLLTQIPAAAARLEVSTATFKNPEFIPTTERKALRISENWSAIPSGIHRSRSGCHSTFVLRRGRLL